MELKITLFNTKNNLVYINLLLYIIHENNTKTIYIKFI